MATIDGELHVRFSGSLKYCAGIAAKYKKDGYNIKRVKGKRHWPFFWVITYHVKMTRPISCNIDIIDEEYNAVESLKNELGLL